ncbi:MAG TPA: alpha-ketoacid dehydrogenase subunit beta [Candidatus Lokiarchaeia archaeon]|nr:alpha-ketoacid dehydrogenase subunit beta [Candidatus Lokiarchaeia archaeon]
MAPVSVFEKDIPAGTREIGVVDALNEALREEMARDENVVLMGEDIGLNWHGAFKVTKNLAEEFGTDRVRDTPISENAIIGCGVGAALTGLHPVCEIMFGDLVTLAMDQIVNQAAKNRFMFGGQASVPLVIRTPFGAGGNYAGHHSSSYEAWFAHVPGLKVVQPSTAFDSKGLLKTAIRDNNPVMFCEHKRCYGQKGPVPEEEYLIPFGVADVKREGDDVTIIATSFMVFQALKAAEILKEEGISAEIIDPRTIRPLDSKTIGNSVKKTGRAIIVHEAVDFGGISGEITKQIIKEAFWYLDAPVTTVAGLDTIVGFSPVFEDGFRPDPNKIAAAAQELIRPA